MTREKAKVLLPVIQAFAEGKTIQVHDSLNGWVDNHSETLSFSCGIDFYRVKPTPTYRPFKDGEELIAEYCKRFGVERKAWEMPQMWVKCGGKCKFLISVIDTNAIAIDGDTTSFDSFVSCYTFLDGSPCGVEEAEE